MVAVPNQMNPVHAPSPSFFKVNSNVCFNIMSSLYA